VLVSEYQPLAIPVVLGAAEAVEAIPGYLIQQGLVVLVHLDKVSQEELERLQLM
jgi:hypothetical protein